MKKLKEMANAIRALTIDAVSMANSGHPGMPLGMADVATVLFTEFLKFNSQDPDWPDRDRFVLSAGHGSMLLYSLLYLTGYKEFTIDEIKNFRQFGSKAAGHPEYGLAKGIENTSGPLGQGLGMGVGMALAERILNARFGDDVVDHYTYIIAGDGCLMEGISHEAASFAGYMKLSKIILFFDDNKISIDGSTSLATSDDHLKRFQSYGWHTQKIDGHNFDQIEEAIKNAQQSDLPSIIAAETIIGKFMPKAGTEKTHSGGLGSEDIKKFRQNIEWPDKDFFVPDDILNSWRSLGAQSLYKKWEENLSRKDENFRANWQKAININSDPELGKVLDKLKEDTKIQQIEKEATRKSSGRVIEFLTKEIEEMVGGSCDLTASNNTKPYNFLPISAANYCGNYIYYGVREHFMAACMNGMALHKGVIPYGGTFLVFADYMRPAIRMSALMGVQVIYIMTHDSIGVGEDGPTHQPIEHLASLRAIPNLNVFRPCDLIETIECWQLALLAKNRPSVIVLSRQDLDFIKRKVQTHNQCSDGAYIIRDNVNELLVNLIATGSEVSVCSKAQELMESMGIGVRLISAPYLDFFDNNYQKQLFDKLARPGIINCVVEAGSSFFWCRYMKEESLIFGINEFGASANCMELYDHFGLTPQHLVERCIAKLKENDLS